MIDMMFELIWILKERGIMKANMKCYEHVGKKEEKLLYMWYKWKKGNAEDETLIQKCHSFEIS
jgi:hypothetical protein